MFKIKMSEYTTFTVLNVKVQTASFVEYNQI
jgi:hypothetical protein